MVGLNFHLEREKKNKPLKQNLFLYLHSRRNTPEKVSSNLVEVILRGQGNSSPHMPIDLNV